MIVEGGSLSKPQTIVTDYLVHACVYMLIWTGLFRYFMKIPQDDESSH